MWNPRNWLCSLCKTVQPRAIASLIIPKREWSFIRRPGERYWNCRASSEKWAWFVKQNLKPRELLMVMDFFSFKEYGPNIVLVILMWTEYTVKVDHHGRKHQRCKRMTLFLQKVSYQTHHWILWIVVLIILRPDILSSSFRVCLRNSMLICEWNFWKRKILIWRGRGRRGWASCFASVILCINHNICLFFWFFNPAIINGIYFLVIYFSFRFENHV